MKSSAGPIRRQIQLCIGKTGTPLGSLVYVRQGRRENCAIAYDEAWLANPERFNVSADLQLALGYQTHKAASPHDSVFHGAIADTVPDAWGRRVIARDHLQNRGFLHVARGLWRLALAFDINPFPDKDRESKTWLSEQDGPITDVQMLLARAAYFALDTDQALATLAEVHTAVSNWRQLAPNPAIGLRSAELDDFAPTFEHEQMEAAWREKAG